MPITLVNQLKALTDYPLFAYQCAQYLVGHTFGTDEARRYEFTYQAGRPVSLTIFNVAGDVVLAGTIKHLQQRLLEEQGLI